MAIKRKDIFISVGHGGSDPGAVGNGLRESDINLSIAKGVKEGLVAKGFNVKMSREKDENDRVQEEVIECNAFNPYITVSIHTNAGGGDGFEIFINKANVDAVVCAGYIEEEVKGIGQNSRGIKGGTHLYYIKNTRATALLVETAFIDNKEDISIVDTKEEQKVFADAIVRGILRFYGISVTQTIKVGSKVKIKADATKWYTGQTIPNWVKGKEYVVDRVDANAYLLDKQGICSLVRKEDVEVV